MEGDGVLVSLITENSSRGEKTLTLELYLEWVECLTVKLLWVLLNVIYIEKIRYWKIA